MRKTPRGTMTQVLYWSAAVRARTSADSALGPVSSGVDARAAHLADVLVEPAAEVVDLVEGLGREDAIARRQVDPGEHAVLRQVGVEAPEQLGVVADGLAA